MLTYETRAALADQHRAAMLAEAEQARMLRMVTGHGVPGSWLSRVAPAWLCRVAPSWLSRVAPAWLMRNQPVPDRRLRDRRVARVPVPVDRRAGYDRRAAYGLPRPQAWATVAGSVTTVPGRIMSRAAR